MIGGETGPSPTASRRSSELSQGNPTGLRWTRGIHLELPPPGGGKNLSESDMLTSWPQVLALLSPRGRSEGHK